MKQWIKDNRIKALAAFILLIGIITRCIQFGRIPSGVNQDEAMGAVDALAIATYGTDRFGVYHPVHLQAWRVGQMSAGLSYLQALCIKLFGFSTVTIRLPLLIVSSISLLLMFFIGKKIKDEKMGLILLALSVINPWHFMQSRWAMDCNLFPHVFLMGLTAMLYGLDSFPLLLLSMVFFGLTFYCYGIAVYSVPVFLLLCAIWLLRKKKISPGKLISCVAVFLITAMPEILVMWINFRKLDTVYTPLFTLQYFSESVRSNDILFMNFSLEGLLHNLKSMIEVAFLQVPGAAYNAPPQFGPSYHISIVFEVIGLIYLVSMLVKRDKSIDKWPYFLVLSYFVTCLWLGAITRDVNVNRINLIFPVLLILTGYGIVCTVNLATNIIPTKVGTGRIIGAGIAIGYAMLAAWFLRYYYFVFDEKVGNSAYFAEYVEAIKKADSYEEYDTVFVSGFTGYKADVKISEILTNYICKHDAHYLQGLTNISNGRSLLPYQERYHYFYSWDVKENELLAEVAPKESIWVVHRNELDLIEGDFNIVGESGDEFVLLSPVE